MQRRFGNGLLPFVEELKRIAPWSLRTHRHAWELKRAGVVRLGAVHTRLDADFPLMPRKVSESGSKTGVETGADGTVDTG